MSWKLGAFRPPPSLNSAPPPWRDQKSNRVPSKSRRWRGAKPGHATAERRWGERPAQVVDARVTDCVPCQADLRDVEAEGVFRRPIEELPVSRPVVLATRQYEVRCPQCAHLQRRVVPEGLEATRYFGPRLEGTGVYLKQPPHVSYERLQRVLADLFGVTVRAGGERCLWRRAGEAAPPEAERIGEPVRQSRVINSDETSGRVDGVKHWEGVLVRVAGVYPRLPRHPSAEVIQGFMGTATDLFQLCLAHPLRDLQKGVDLFPRARWAAAVQALFRQAIPWAKRPAILTARGFQAPVTRLERKLERLLARQVKHQDARPRQDRYQTQRAHGRVVLPHPEVPYDHNGCERAWRPSVMHRKVIGGFRSTWGAHAQAA